MNHLERLHEHGRSTCVSQPESAAVINNVHQRQGGEGGGGWEMSVYGATPENQPSSRAKNIVSGQDYDPTFERKC